MMQVICDTSFMMVLGSTPLLNMERLESALGTLHFFVPNIVVEELKRLERDSGPKRSKMARAALILIDSKFDLINLPRSKYADDAIIKYSGIKYSGFHRCAVATIDKALKRRLIRNKVLVITLRDNKLILDNTKY